MATAAVATPVRAHRLPLTPKSSPLTPSRNTPSQKAESIHTGVSKFKLRTAGRPSSRDSTKSNIVAGSDSPRRLELGISDWTLTGTGPSNKHTPSKSAKRPAARARNSKTHISYKAADRFIPNRTASDAISNHDATKFEPRPKSSSSTASQGSTVLAQSAAGVFDIGLGAQDHLISSLDNLNIQDDETESPAKCKPSPGTIAYQNTLADTMGIPRDGKYLAFKPAPPERKNAAIDLRTSYNRPLKPAAASAQKKRHVPTAAERVLDLPGFADDYYLNLLDWSCHNNVAIGLNDKVYIWNANSGTASELCDCSSDTYISSVKWSQDGGYLSVGLGTGAVEVWDADDNKRVRTLTGHDTRVGVMGWSKHILSTGSRSGLVTNSDVRIRDHKVADLVSHTAEVCGLEWRADGSQLATGGNDNLVSIWDARSLAAPKFSKNAHRAAVKALSWCPWQPNLLATGGGSNDRHIHFWNSTTGARTNSIDTGSQVTSLRWSTHYKELISTSGFPDNSLSIWSYPSLVKNYEIPAHESRILHSAVSPDGQTLATAAADENLKFWTVWEKKTAGSSNLKAARTSDGFQRVTTIR